MKVLLLEDDLILSDIISSFLTQECGFNVTHVEDGESALDKVNNFNFDLIILDINVPKIPGLEVLRQIREYKNKTPIIVITAYQDTTYLKRGFRNGCDDYIKKPFDLEELDLRIKNIQKRFGLNSESKIDLGCESFLAGDKNRLYVGDKIFQLSKKESEIILYLNLHRGRVISSEELIQNLWEYESMPSDATIRVYIKKIRNILGKDRIQTIRGSGYCFE